MFRNLQPEELRELSPQIDTYNYLMNLHFTTDPQMPRYSNYPPNDKTTKRDLENSKRIEETIKNYIKNK